MAKRPLTDATVWVDDYDLSGDLNNVGLAYTADGQECTTFGGDGYRERLQGLKSVDLDVAGFWQIGDDTVGAHLTPDDLGSARGITTVTERGTDGDQAFCHRGVDTSLNVLGEIGGVTPFSVTQQGRVDVAVNGTLLLPKQTVTGDVDGTAVQLGTVAATEKLYTVIHVFSAGTTADIIVESDSQSDFAGSPTERSSTTVTAAGGTWVTPVDGAIADDWWRVSVDTVTGSFSVAVAVAIA